MSENFEMANVDDPREIILATHRSLISSMRDVVDHLKLELNTQGLTWEQIDFMIKGFEEKEPKIVIQNQEM